MTPDTPETPDWLLAEIAPAGPAPGPAAAPQQPPPPGERCGNCRFASVGEVTAVGPDADPAGDDYEVFAAARCLRFPPPAAAAPPPVDPDDGWCGEWAPARPPA